MLRCSVEILPLRLSRQLIGFLVLVFDWPITVSVLALIHPCCPIDSIVLKNWSYGLLKDWWWRILLMLLRSALLQQRQAVMGANFSYKLFHHLAKHPVVQLDSLSSKTMLLDLCKWTCCAPFHAHLASAQWLFLVFNTWNVQWSHTESSVSPIFTFIVPLLILGSPRRRLYPALTLCKRRFILLPESEHHFHTEFVANTELSDVILNFIEKVCTNRTNNFGKLDIFS